MKRKVLIIIVAVIFSGIMITHMWLVLKRDYENSTKQRLTYVSENLHIQQSNVINTFEKIADYFFLTSVGKEGGLDFYRLTNNQRLTISEIKEAKSIQRIGFSLLKLENIVEKPPVGNQHYFFRCTNGNNSISKEKGVAIYDNFFGFTYRFPLTEPIKGYFILGIEHEKLLAELTSLNPDTRFGLFVHGYDSVNYNDLYSREFLVQSGLMKNFWHDKTFQLPDVFLKDKSGIDELKTKLDNAITNNIPDRVSVFFENGEKRNVLSLCEIGWEPGLGSIFVVSISYDDYLERTRSWRDRMLLLNTLMILFIVAILVYLFINRVNLLREKSKVVKSSQRLKELNLAKDKFFSIIAHDLKNPFNGIMGMSSYLTDDFDSIEDEEKREIITDINIASKNAFNLLQNLLEWTRSQTGLIKYTPRMLDTSSLIDLSLETVLFLAKNKDIHIEIKIETNLNPYADENLISTVLRNLVTNAVKFSPRSSNIEITVRKSKDFIVFMIKDQGVGIREDEIDKLFRIDITFHKKGTEDEQGSGLGLKLCKEFVERCGGKIWVISELGEGSTFFFTLPIYIEGVSKPHKKEKPS